MNLIFLSEINYLAVAVASVIFFFIGSIWFSALFKHLWVQELKHHHVTIKEPSRDILLQKMLLTFGANVLASLAMAHLVIITGSATLMSGFILGTLVALGFAVPTLGSVFVWESRSLTLYLIDVGYSIVGFIAIAMLLSVWQ